MTHVTPEQNLTGRVSLLELKVDERIDALNRRNAELEVKVEAQRDMISENMDQIFTLGLAVLKLQEEASK
jgi:hypothetical protein